MGRKKKILEIDNLRALAIIIVVLGHSIILYSNSWGVITTSVHVPFLNTLKAWVNLVQMPLFLSISGFLFRCNYLKTNFSDLIKQKSLRLIVPYIVFFFLWLIPIRAILGLFKFNSIRQVLINDLLLGDNNGHLWFLPCLFFCFLLGYLLLLIVDSFSNMSSIIMLVGVLITSAGPIFADKIMALHMPLVVSNVIVYFFWFGVGFVVREYYDKLRQLHSYTFTCFGIGLICSYFAVQHPSRLNTILSLLILIAIYIVIPATENNLIKFISTNSFGIYLIHSPLIYITATYFTNVSPVIVVVLNFFVFGCLSVLLSNLIRRSNLKFIIGN